MAWRCNQEESRQRHTALFDPRGADEYHRCTGDLRAEMQQAYVDDLIDTFPFRPGLEVLDVGAGSGTLCHILQKLAPMRITALEPMPALLRLLRDQTELQNVKTVQGFCDHPHDRAHFGPGQFDLIASRQVVNGLYDPLTAFQNWHDWLKPGGAVMVIDGLYPATAWTGLWSEEPAVLPLSCCGSTALIPYLLQSVGFQIRSVNLMTRTNQMPATRTTRYTVIARKTVIPRNAETAAPV